MSSVYRLRRETVQTGNKRNVGQYLSQLTMKNNVNKAINDKIRNKSGIDKKNTQQIY